MKTFINNLLSNIANATVPAKPAAVVAADARNGTTAWWWSYGQKVEIKYHGARWLHVEEEDSYVFTSGYRRTWWSNTMPISKESILHTVRGDRWERSEYVNVKHGFMVRQIGPATYEVAEYRLH